jgi:EAL domain-containing protein (putative c-di-GMP-specific phosphodiesterase class I)
MERSTENGLGLLSELRRAVEEDELMLVFQPKILLRSGACDTAEALVRWRHPLRGIVTPDEFIPFAEQTGFIRSITTWVIRRALQQIVAWQAMGLTISLNVNVSTRDLTQQDLPVLVREALQLFGVAPQRLCLEVTEGAIMEDPTRALAALEALHAMGVRLSIDDFGTGHSSLAYLKKLPMDELKIDRSFVMDIDENEDDDAIVRSTIDLAHNMGLSVVAEGVQSEAALQRLVALGCDEAQGYLFSRPLPAEELAHWMRSEHRVLPLGDLVTG